MRRILFSLITAFSISTVAAAEDELIIISPHRKSIQEEFIPVFKVYYKEKFKTDVKVSWLDQGGSSDDIRFVRAKYEKNPASAGIDIFWGGGTSTFLELGKEGFLSKYRLPTTLQKEIPEKAAGVALYDKTETWYASAMSSFGIFYNKKVLKLEKIPEPKTWSDLASPVFKENLSLSDPRRSGTATTMNNIILQSQGWEKGWNTLTMIAGNTRHFTQSSSDPIKAIVSADAAASMAIDFYANAKIGDLGSANLGFILPDAETVIDPDPIAILKGAPHREVAERFVDFILSAPAQQILILPKGVKGGPKLESLGRMAVNYQAYNQTHDQRPNEVNPFNMQVSLKLDLNRAALIHSILGDLVGALHIDTHEELKKAWKAVIARGNKPADIAALGKMSQTEPEILSLAAKWDDAVFRNKKINEWTEFAKAKYKKIAAGSI
jgi:ABC-type Fe3+ transport system substrate-binding protein